MDSGIRHFGEMRRNGEGGAGDMGMGPHYTAEVGEEGERGVLRLRAVRRLARGGGSGSRTWAAAVQHEITVCRQGFCRCMITQLNDFPGAATKN